MFYVSARPTNPKTINFFIEVGRLLAGDFDPDADQGVNKADRLVDHCEIIGIDPGEIDSLIRSDSITKTCRLITSALVPKEKRAEITWKDIPQIKRHAILGTKKLIIIDGCI